MTVRRVLLPILLAGGLLLSACGGPTVLKGTVVAKNFVPEHTYTTYYTIMVGKVPVIESQYHDDPPEWQLDVSDGKNSAWDDVSQSFWQHASVGEYVNLK